MSGARLCFLHQHCPPRPTGVGSRRATRRTSPNGQHSLRHPRSAGSSSPANARRAARRSASARRQSWNAHNYVHVTGSALRTELGTPKQSYTRTELICILIVHFLCNSLYIMLIQGGAKNGATGHPISLQIIRKLHDRIACKLVDFCNIIC